MSSQRIRDLFEIATWVYQRHDLPLMDVAVIAASPQDVLGLIDDLDFPTELRPSLLLAWGALQAAREAGQQEPSTLVPADVLRREVVRSVFPLPRVVRNTWLFEATLPWFSNSVDRATLLEPLIRAETILSFRI